MHDYVQKAMRTCAPGDQFLHCVLGLTSEMAEVHYATTEAGQREELGDLMWYVAIGADYVGLTLHELIDATTEDPRDGLFMIGQLANLMKRQIFYGKAPNLREVAELLSEIVRGIREDCVEIGHDFDEILAENIAKLTRRYPEKFTQDLAVTC